MKPAPVKEVPQREDVRIDIFREFVEAFESKISSF
jgi:hypothetical protein